MPRRHVISQVVRSASPEITCPEIIQREHSIISIIFLPEMQNMNIIMRKQERNSNRRIFFRITDLDSNTSCHKGRKTWGNSLDQKRRKRYCQVNTMHHSWLDPRP